MADEPHVFFFLSYFSGKKQNSKRVKSEETFSAKQTDFSFVYQVAPVSQRSHTLNSQLRPHLVLEADVLSPQNLHAAVVASAVLQGGAADSQRQVVLPGVPLQAVPLVLLGPRVTGSGPRAAGATVQDGGALPVAKTPQHLQR